MVKENAKRKHEFKLQIKKKDETRNYFIEEIKELFNSKKYKKTVQI